MFTQCVLTKNVYLWSTFSLLSSQHTPHTNIHLYVARALEPLLCSCVYMSFALLYPKVRRKWKRQTFTLTNKQSRKKPQKMRLKHRRNKNIQTKLAICICIYSKYNDKSTKQRNQNENKINLTNRWMNISTRKRSEHFNVYIYFNKYTETVCVKRVKWSEFVLCVCADDDEEKVTEMDSKTQWKMIQCSSAFHNLQISLSYRWPYTQTLHQQTTHILINSVWHFVAHKQPIQMNWMLLFKWFPEHIYKNICIHQHNTIGAWSLHAML